MKNPLFAVLSPRTRQVLYAILFVCAVVFACWQAAGGDVLEFVGGLVTALLGAMAASNVEVPTAGERRSVSGGR